MLVCINVHSEKGQSMTKGEFLGRLIECLDRFDYQEKDIRIGAEVYTFGKRSLYEIIDVLNASMNCLEQLPASPFTVTGGLVHFSMEEKKGVLHFKIDTSPLDDSTVAA